MNYQLVFLQVESLEARIALDADAFEPNNSFAHAVEVSHSPHTLRGLAIDVEDEDWFKWKADNEGLLSVNLTFFHTSGDLDLELYDARRNRVAVADSVSNDEHLSLAVSSGEEYFIRVFGFMGQTNVYDLSIAGPSAGGANDRFEPNPDRLRAASLGSGDQLQPQLLLNGSADEDWYAWTATETGDATIAIAFVDPFVDASLDIFDSAGSRLTSSPSTNGVAMVSSSVRQNQQLFIRVSSSTERIAVYELSIDGPGAFAAPTAPLTLLSFNDSTKLGNLLYKPGDIVSFDGVNFDLFFDGSDVGIHGVAIDGLDFTPVNELLLSFMEPIDLPGIPQTVDDSDIVRFVPTTFGDTTSGLFEMYLDGSDVGLTNPKEDVAGISLLEDGRLVITTQSGAVLPGLTADAGDLLAFSPQSFGEQSRGSWDVYLDSSDIGLQDARIDAVSAAASGLLHLSTGTTVSTNGLLARDEDVFVFVPDSLGENTAGTLQTMLSFSGSLAGMDLADVIGVDVDSSVVVPSVIVAPTTGLVTSEAGATTSFEVVLSTRPSANVRIPLQSSNVREGVVLESELIFTPTNWNTARRVNVVGVDDGLFDGDVQYTVNVLQAVSSDVNYNAFDAPDVSVLNVDNETGLPPGEGARYFSVNRTTSVQGLTVNDEDIVSVVDGQANLFVDGSDIGLTDLRLDAFDIISPSEILMSFTDAAEIPGIPQLVDDSDIVLFRARRLGSSTEGSFELYFDGSDVGLTTSNEDVKGIAVLSDGLLLITTNFAASVPGLQAENADVAAFRPSSLGPDTRGEWSLYFDGSDVGIQSADLDAISVDSTGNLYLSVTRSVSLGSLTAGGEDIFVFRPATLGPDTLGTFASTLFLDGSLLGLEEADVFGFDVDGSSAPLTTDVIVSHETDLETNEDGLTANFKVILGRRPRATVSIPIQSSDTSEGVPSTTLLTFDQNNWNVPQSVTVRGINDSVTDGDIEYTVLIGPVQSGDAVFNGFNPSDVRLVNRDNDFDDGDGPDTATQVLVPSMTNARLDSGSDRDWFSFEAQAGVRYAIETVLGTLTDTTLTLYERDGTTVVDSDDDGGPGFASRIVWTAQVSGRYFIRVAGFRRETGSYSLSVSRDVIAPSPADGLRFVSVRSSSVVNGIQVEDEDIIAYDGSTFSVWFDGSDVGLAQQRIDAFDVINDHEILLSFTGEVNLPDLDMPVADSDVVKFVAGSTGPSTSGKFELFFDGSDVGLSSGREDIKGLTLLSDGRLLVTTNFQVNVPNVTRGQRGHLGLHADLTWC